MEKLLIFGGSFNPIHSGHIEMACRVKKRLGIDRVVFVPTGKSGYKETDDFASRNDRLNMCIIALKDTDIEISTVELDREEQSYTYETVAELKRRNPQSELYFLCGSDMLLTLHLWRNPKQIFDYSKLVAVLRDDDDIDTLNNYKKQYFPENEIIFLDVGKIDISSSQIRADIKSGRKPQGIDDGVYDYIMQKGLYIKR